MPPSSTPSDPHDLLATVRQTLAVHHMLAAGDRVLVGVSGGPDSMVLLNLLYRLAPAFEISLGVAHLNHCLRGASADRDAQTVRQAAIRIGVPCHMGKAHVARVKQGLKLSLEEAARRVRYAFFQKIMLEAGYNKLALGHHRDDNAEQMLMALLRGAGPRGLCGIVPIRQNRVLRPLIRVQRSQIKAYANEMGIPWVTDESNLNLDFVRNRIRHKLLPLLSSEYNPRITKHLDQLADVMRMEEEWIDGMITQPYQDALIDHSKAHLIFDAGILRQMHPALVRRLIRRALLDLFGTLQRISFIHVQGVLGLVMDAASDKTVHLPRGIRIRCGGDRLEISRIKAYRRTGGRQQAIAPLATTIVISPPFPRTVKFKSMRINMTFFTCRPDELPPWQTMGLNSAFFDLDRLSFPLILRRKLTGDRFMPLGGGGSQKVKKYFIDHHIPQKDRAEIPVLADQRQIIWLVGQRIDDRVKVTSATTQVLGAEFYLLDTR